MLPPNNGTVDIPAPPNGPDPPIRLFFLGCIINNLS